MKEQTPRILCIEDDKTLCKMLKSLFELMPSRFEFATNGDDAIEKLLDVSTEQDPYSLIILDAEVPFSKDDLKAKKHFGIQMLMEIKRSYFLLGSEVPVIVYTGKRPSIEKCVACMRAGATDYIPKEIVGENSSEILFEKCKTLLYPKPLAADPFDSWISLNHSYLTDNFSGKSIGLIDSSTPLGKKIKGEHYKGMIILENDSFDGLRYFILKDPVLRWCSVPIFRILAKEISDE